MSEKKFRYRFLAKNEMGFFCFYCSLEDLEKGKLNKKKKELIKEGYEFYDKSEYVGTYYNKYLFEGDPILLVTFSDSGERRTVTKIDKSLKGGKNIGGRGGNAYIVIKDIIPIDTIEREVFDEKW